MKAIKITNPFYIQYAAPEIKKYVDKANMPGVTYESFVTFLQQVAQFGGNASELWMVLYENKPVAFMQINIMGLPYIGTCFCNHICSWAKDKKAVELLIKEFEKFGQKHNCTIYSGHAMNAKLFKYYASKADMFGYELKGTGIRPFYCVRKKNEDLQKDKD